MYIYIYFYMHIAIHDLGNEMLANSQTHNHNAPCSSLQGWPASSLYMLTATVRMPPRPTYLKGSEYIAGRMYFCIQVPRSR